MGKFVENLKNDKKMMFKFIGLIAILVVLAIINFTGGDSEDASGDASADAVTEEESADASDPSSISPTEETLGSTEDTPCLQIGKTTLFLGEATVQDLVDAGATFVEESEASVVEFSEDPLQERSLEFTVSDTTLYVTVQNPEDEIMQLKDSVIMEAYWEGESIIATAGVMYGDTLEELIAKAGEPYTVINSEDYNYEIGSLPSTSRVYTYCDTIDHATLLVTVDRNTYQVNHIELQTAGVCITDAAEVSQEQMQELVDDYFLQRTVPESVTYESADGITTSGEVSDLSFSQVQVAVVRDFETRADAEDFYEAKATGYLYSSYLLVEYTATILFDDGSSKTGVGGFVVYDPGVDASGSIISLSDRDYSSDISYVYASAEDYAEDVLTPSSYYEISFSADDYVVTGKVF